MFLNKWPPTQHLFSVLLFMIRRAFCFNYEETLLRKRGYHLFIKENLSSRPGRADNKTLPTSASNGFALPARYDYTISRKVIMVVNGMQTSRKHLG